MNLPNPEDFIKKYLFFLGKLQLFPIGQPHCMSSHQRHDGSWFRNLKTLVDWNGRRGVLTVIYCFLAIFDARHPILITKSAFPITI
jgi:hypothetical protein